MKFRYYLYKNKFLIVLKIQNKFFYFIYTFKLKLTFILKISNLSDLTFLVDFTSDFLNVFKLFYNLNYIFFLNSFLNDAKIIEDLMKIFLND